MQECFLNSSNLHVPAENLCLVPLLLQGPLSRWPGKARPAVPQRRRRSSRPSSSAEGAAGEAARRTASRTSSRRPAATARRRPSSRRLREVSAHRARDLCVVRRLAAAHLPRSWKRRPQSLHLQAADASLCELRNWAGLLRPSAVEACAL